MKRILAVWLVFALCLSGAWAAEGRDLSGEEAMAGQLQAVGLFQGTDRGFELDRAMSRTEAVVMLVRALGKDQEAQGHGKTHPFADVPAWADGYVSYAWEQGLTSGISETEFGAEGTASAEMYLTFMLRALGYSSQWDFSWRSPWALAAWRGILPPQVDRRDFLRGDAVTVTCAALFARVKGAEGTLHARLAEEGALDAEAFAKAFPADPLEEYRALDAKVAQAVAASVPVGQIAGDEFISESHILLGVTEAEDGTAVHALVNRSYGMINRDNTPGMSGYAVALDEGYKENGLWRIELEPETLAPRACRSLGELEAAGLDPFSPQDRADAADLAGWNEWDRVHALDALEMLAAGEIGYRASTYDEVMAQLERTSGYYQVRRLESPLCTVLYYEIGGTSHGSIGYLALIYKEAPPEGAETQVHLPLPRENHWGLTQSEPLTMELDGAGTTLTYTYRFDSRWVEEEGTEQEWVVHEQGTYSYTTDLRTGETVLEIVGE